MKIGIIREKDVRVALVPEVAKKFFSLGGIEIAIEKDLTNLYSDEDYEKVGVKVMARKDVLSKSDMVLFVNPPSIDDIASIRKGTITISFMDPYNNKELVNAYVKQGVSAISMEMIPRSTLAQKMDALSSQASLAGYAAVILGAKTMRKIFPMMMTPAGTIKPAKVFVIGAGVAGLQAIATAKRLGARVEAFDTRPVVKEQVESLGSKFLEIDLGDMGQTKDGYAKELTKEQLDIQRKAMTNSCAGADLVITTAKLFGRKAPITITADMVSSMKPGSVIVDLAAGTGGNVEGTVKDEIIEVGGVTIIGIDNLPGEVALDASIMYSSNLYNFFAHFYDKENKEFKLDLEEEIIKGCLITHKNKMVNERLKGVYQ